MWLLILISVIVLSFVYTRLTQIYSYWYTKGVRTVSPVYWFRFYHENAVRGNASAHNLKKIYDRYQGEQYIGLYQFSLPVLLIFDPELIKRICIQDFNSFSDHSDFVQKDMDPLYSRNLFIMGSKDGWQDIRGIMTPFFTSSRMRTMFPLIQECTNHFLTFLKTDCVEVVVEMKDTCSRYALDVIAKTAFGISVDSINDKNNEMYSMVKKANDLNTWKGLTFIALSVLPFLNKLLSIKFYKKSVATFFNSLIEETLRYRTKSKVIRPDLVHLFIEARENRYEPGIELTGVEKTFEKKHNLELTDDYITGNMLLLFFAGVESISTTLSYICYELTKNYDIQEKVRDEIRQVLSHSNGQVTYDVINSMKYLDNVISETLRLHPPTTLVDRKCVKPYILDDEKQLLLEENLWIWFPVGAIHRDENYFPNPDKFDPDRFNEENKHNIIPFTYFPFGLGQRKCIGSKLAMLECKLLLVEILTKYELVIPKNSMKLLSTEEAEKYPEKIWIGFKPKI